MTTDQRVADRRARWAKFRGCLWCVNTRQIKTDERGYRTCPFCIKR